MKYSEHVKNWEACTRCPLHERRRKVCIARGMETEPGHYRLVLPSQVCFVGEAPGESEDDFGIPFAGPAGHLLNSIVKQALVGRHSVPNCAFTNLVGCIPRDEDHRKIKEGPPSSCVKTCAPKLKEFVRICRPELIVCVGDQAKTAISGQAQFSNRKDNELEWLDGQFLEFIEITHPAAILRANVAQRSWAIRKCVARIATALDSLGYH